MDDFEKFKKCIGEPVEAEIKGEKFLFKPLKGKDLWKLMKLGYDLQGKPEEVMTKINDERLDLVKELGFRMLKEANPTISDEQLNEFIDYNLLDIFRIINEVNYGTREAKQEKVLTRLEELRKSEDTPADTTGG